MTIKVKKNIINICTFAIAITIGIILFAKPLAHASDENVTQVEWLQDIMGGISTTIHECVNATDEGLGVNVYESCITIDTRAEISALTTSLKICGGFLAMIIAVSHLFSNLEKGMEQMEAIWKVLIELLITGLLLANMNTIVTKLCEFGNIIISQVSGAVGELPIMSVANCEAILTALVDDKMGGLSWQIKTTLILLVPWVLSLFVKLATKFCVYQVALEIGIRKIFLPLAIADIYQEGLRSPGVRYLKKLVACFLKIAMCASVGIIIAAIVTEDMITGVIGGERDGIMALIWSLIALNATGVGFMLKGGEVANDVTGA